MTTPTDTPPLATRARRKLGDWNLGDGRSIGPAPEERTAPGVPERPGTPGGHRPAGRGPRRGRELLAARARHPSAHGAGPGPALGGTGPGLARGATGPAPAGGATASEAAGRAGAAPVAGRVGPGPAMDPRMRQRRVDVERAHGRRRSHLVVAAVAAVVLVAGAVGALHTSLLSVRHVTVTGRSPLTGDRLLAAAGLAPGDPLWDVHGAAAAERLQRLPWVDSATVRRVWPQTVDIAVSRRSALVQVPLGSAPRGPVAEVDATGRVLATVATPVAGLPLLLGVAPPGPVGSWLAGSAGAGHPLGTAATRAVAATTALDDADDAVSGALAFAAAIASADAGQGAGGGHGLVSLEVSGGATIAATVTPGPVIVVLGPPTLLAAKATALVSMERSQALVGGSILDLDVPSRPTVTAGTDVATLP